MQQETGCDGLMIARGAQGNPWIFAQINHVSYTHLAGQTVFHFHMHLIPRYKGDKNDDILKYTPLELSDDEMKEILDMIKVK